MNYEERINELEERISKLEKIEKKRKIAKIVKILLKLIACAIIVFFIYKAYLFVKPYKEKIDNLSKIEEKISGGTDTIKGALEKFNLFGD